MRAVVMRGPREVAVETVEDTRIDAPTDVLLRLTSSAICGTDLHIYEGRMGDVAGTLRHRPKKGDPIMTERAQTPRMRTDSGRWLERANDG